MSDTSIFEISSEDIDVKNYTKVRTKCALNDKVYLKLYVYDYNSPIDLSQFNIEFRAILPKSKQIYSEVNNITKNGNLLTISCDSFMTGEIGEVVSYIRLWNLATEQKSSYQIRIKVMPTIDEDEKVAESSLLSGLASLDLAIDRYIELKATLTDKIDEATLSITNITTAITNANVIKTSLDIANSNALTTKTSLDSSISNANSVKTNLDPLVVIANTTKSNLDASNVNAQISKTSLQALVSTADTKIQEFKNFDTNQIVLKTNEMYNEMYPINELLTIEHDLNTSPLVQFIITEDGYGMGTYGTSYYGGISECNLGIYKVQYLGKNKLKIIVSNNYNYANPIITKANDYEYVVSFAGYNKTMTIKLIV